METKIFQKIEIFQGDGGHPWMYCYFSTGMGLNFQADGNPSKGWELSRGWFSGWKALSWMCNFQEDGLF